MRKLLSALFTLLTLLALPASVHAQATHIQTSGTLPASCRVGDIYLKTGTSAGFYTCSATNTWSGPYSTSAGTVGGSTGSTDNALIRADGTGGATVQSSAITVSDAGAITFPDGVRQTFNPDGTNAGINVGSQAGDPSSPTNGDLWYDSTANELTARINGSNVALGAGGGGGGGTPGGSSGDIQYNNAGSFGGYSVVPGANGGGLVLLEQHTASSSASLDFTSCISSTYDDYVIRFSDVVPATNAVNFYMRMSTNGGVSYDNGSNYRWVGWYLGLGDVFSSIGSSGATEIRLNQSTGTTANWNLNGAMNLFHPGSSDYKFTDTTITSPAGGTLYRWSLSGSYLSTTAVNAFQFFFSSGNIASGTIRCYGLAK